MLYRERPGDGPTLVLLPGSVLDTTRLSWKYLLEYLPDHYRVIVPDLPGYGGSERPRGACTTATYVRFVAGFLEALGLDRVVLCGSSMGGAVALGAALAYPERVERLVLSGAYGLQPRMPLHEAAYALSRLPGLAAPVRTLLRRWPGLLRAVLHLAVHRPGAVTDELVDDAYAGLTPPGALEPFMDWFRHELTPRGVRSDASGRLGALTMPVLLLHGAHDWMMPVRYARRAAARLPDARLFVCDACSHLVPREAPDAVWEAVVTFLEG